MNVKTVHREEGSTVREKERSLPVMGVYDVVVVGGGMAGVAAALAAARNGRFTCLVEKAYGLGGLATLGNVIVWLPLCDGRGRQVVGGLGEELLKLSVRDLGCDHPTARFHGIPACWQPGGDQEARKKIRYRVEFNPGSYLLALEKLVSDAGVKLLYDSRVCAVDLENHRIRHLMVENKSGRGALLCRTVVDATGDADICFWAGEKIESLDSNVLCGWFYYLQDGTLRLEELSNPFSRYAAKEDAVGPFFRGDDAEQVTAHVLATRELIRKRLADLRKLHPEADIQIVLPPSIACFRMTRRLVGSFSLGEQHVHEWFDDAVGITGDWRKPGPIYAIPFRALRGVATRNLLVAGRCISADRTAWDVMRVIPGCVLTGEAAGTAAAIAVRDFNGDVHSLPAGVLQHQLRVQGALLDPALVKP